MKKVTKKTKRILIIFFTLWILLFSVVHFVIEIPLSIFLVMRTFTGAFIITMVYAFVIENIKPKAS